MSGLALPSKNIRRFFARGADGAWHRSLQFLAASWAALLLLFWRDTADMAEIWWNSSTFNHCLLILPILVWLVYQRKDELGQLTPKPWWPAIAWFGAGAGGWLLGEAAGVALARQAGLVMMLQGSAATLLGPQVTRGLLFPLFYMFFLVPAGEELVPALQTFTAKMCMFFLGLTGIPAHIDGIFITTPGGYFKVAEACSGVKFLVAMVAYGALVSNVCFKSWPRRAAFMALSIVVPIFANGLRAFGTIYIAEHTGIEFAASWDHVFYGWIFFAIVLVIVMAIGWRFFDRKPDEAAFDPALLSGPVKGASSFRVAMPAMAAIAALPLLWSALVMNRPAELPAHIDLPQVAGWEIVPYKPARDWKPRFDGASHYLFGRYHSAEGHDVDLFAVVYDRQQEGHEIVGFAQGAANPNSEWAWTEDMPAPANGRAERIKAPGPVVRDVLSFYRVNGTTTGSAMKVKIETLKARLLAGDQQAVGIILSSEYRDNRSPRPALDKFLKDLGSIDKVADRMAGLD
ncbi:MAG: exosortase A [Sphingorhabdus sp.]